MRNLPHTRPQQPELDPLSQAGTKKELEAGVDRITSFPIDGAARGVLRFAQAVNRRRGV